MTIDSWLKRAKTELIVAGISSAGLDAELLLSHVLGKPREYLLAHTVDELPNPIVQTADDLVKKRADRHPLVHLTGMREFYGLALEITPDVLTPRVETELMVDMAVKYAPKNGSLLDVGTGSGAIAIAIAKNRPDLTISVTDISPEALRVAARNIKTHHSSITLINSNLLDRVTGRFDVITANLPYLRDDAELMPEVTREPKVALVGGVDGLDLYRQLFEQVRAHLSGGGLVLIEADPWQHAELIKISKNHQFEVLQDDYFILSLKLSAKA